MKEVGNMNENVNYVPVLPYEISNVNVQSMQPLLNHNGAFFMERYKPLIFNGIQGFPNPVSSKVREHLPEFNEKISESTRQHL